MIFQTSLFKEIWMSQCLFSSQVSTDRGKERERKKKSTENQEYYRHHPFLYSGGVSMEKWNLFSEAVEFRCDYRAGKM